MKHSRNSQQIQGDFQDFEAPAPAEPEYAGEVTMALPPVPMPDPNARRGLAHLLIFYRHFFAHSLLLL